MREELGVDGVRAYNHDLAWRGAQAPRRALGRRSTTPEAMVGSMITVPLPAGLGPAVDDAQRLRDALLFSHGIEVPVLARGGALWARLSVQVYNDDEDVERFAAAVEMLAAA